SAAPVRPARRLGPASLLVLHRDFHSLPQQPQRPAAGTLERLDRHGPRLATQQQMIEWRPRNGSEIGLDPHPIHGHTGPVHLHITGSSSDGVATLPSPPPHYAECG